MKHPRWMATIFIITIVALVGVFYFFSPPPHSPDSQLDVNSLRALTDGHVSFNVILQEGASAILEAVVLNDARYSWSDGSHEDQTILNGETKPWSINIGSLQKGSTMQVVVEATPESGSGSVTVESPPSNENHPNDTDYVYDDYGGVGVFTEGIHIFATDQDPRTMSGDFLITNNFWKMLREHETTRASDQDFISILLARGDKPTGGYNIQIEAFSWLESYPVKFLFQVNFTDPGENVVVTQALTNPLVLVPIGKLTPGEYHIEVPITQYILNIDDEGNPQYTPILTFAPVIWEQTLMIHSTEDPTASTTFEVTLNENEAPNLTVPVDLSNGLTEAEATKIAEAAFVRTMGEKVLRRLDTLTYDDEQITVHYTWGVDETDMGHIFDLTADLVALQITINHCR